MLPRTTFEVVLDDVRLALNDYPAIRPMARNWMASYQSEADSKIYAAIRDELERFD